MISGEQVTLPSVPKQVASVLVKVIPKQPEISITIESVAIPRAHAPETFA